MGRFPEEAGVELGTEARIGVHQEKKGEWPRQRQEPVGGGDRRRSWKHSGREKYEKRPLWVGEGVRGVRRKVWPMRKVRAVEPGAHDRGVSGLSKETQPVEDTHNIYTYKQDQ